MTNNSEQLSLLNNHPEADNTPVVCLGMKFKNEKARREYFRKELRKKLPELKQIEGFPIGEDEDIITLSDPPYYTACPNPWINDFIEEWEKEKETKYGRDVDEEYYREPFATDISEGKNNTVYNAHSYHTKVPHKAIMRYILHYTEPGDIIYDGFSGSGMTGLASEMCNSIEEIKSLGFICDSDGNISDANESGIKIKSKVGYRRAILADIAPAATFIAYNYNKKANKTENDKILRKLLTDVEAECGWAYSTFDKLSEDPAIIEEIKSISNIEDAKRFHKKYYDKLYKVNYFIWSEVYGCNVCQNEVDYWEAIVNPDEQSVKKEMYCPNCNAFMVKKETKKIFESRLDNISGKIVEQPKIVPKKVSYTVEKKRFDKNLDLYDYKILQLINDHSDFKEILDVEILEGVETLRPKRLGYNKAHHFYNIRTLYMINCYIKLHQNTSELHDAQFLLGSVLPKLTKMNRYMPQYASKEKGFRALVGPMANTLYFPSLHVENNFVLQALFQLNKIINAWNELHGNVISTQSSTDINIKSNSVDYIFIDPPFGANIMYSELSFAREAWLKVRTNNQKEAIENKVQNKTINDYTRLISDCFKEAYRILKPDRWITVEFSNTQSSIWNAIQHALQESGFVIASVDALNKERGGFHAMITTTAVKQDLVISAYKPSQENIDKMLSEKNTPDSAWTFVSQHLEKLPIFLGSKGEASVIAERTTRILFDRMVAYHVQNGLPVPISSAEFQEGVAQRFPMRDGMAFIESQIAEYDKKRILVKEFSQMSLFVSDENSAIEWIRQQLMRKPQTRQDLHPRFMKEIQHIAKHEQLPELDDLLAQNFLRFEGDEAVPDQIVSYLHRNYKDMRGLTKIDDKLKEKARNRWYVPNPNKQADLEKLREKALLREFANYVAELGTHKKKLRQFRTEAIRAGFKKAWSEKNYEKIVTVGDRLPETVIQEDEKLLMYYDNAQVRLDI